MTYRTYHILTAQQEPYRITKNFFLVFWEKSQENGPLALLPAPKCLRPSFIHIICALKLLFVLGLSLYYFFIGTIYTVAGHCAKLNASCLRKGFFTPLHKFGSSCRWSALPPSYNQFIVWNGGKWSRDINQVVWLVVCRSAQKRMSDDSTQSGCANKEHQTNYSQSGGANSHSDHSMKSISTDYSRNP